MSSGYTVKNDGVLNEWTSRTRAFEYLYIRVDYWDVSEEIKWHASKRLRADFWTRPSV